MEEQNEFERLIKDLASKTTIERANSISDKRIRILSIDKEVGLINADVQGNSIVPYKIILDLSQENLPNIIYHDCPDYLARKKPNNKFCKHVMKFFLLLMRDDPDFTLKLLNQLHKKIHLQSQIKLKKDLSPDMNHFLNEGLENQLDFGYNGFDYFFDIIEIDDPGRACLKEILMEAKKLPAALGGYHGAYEGGLFDHILLVTNYAYKLCKSVKYQVDIKKAVLTAIYHDFGKISYYSYKKKIIHSNVISDREELDIIHKNIEKKYKYFGRHSHVEEALAVLKKNEEKLFNDDEISKAIIFHHGKWSKYYPIEMNELANLIHEADMIASHTHFI